MSRIVAQAALLVYGQIMLPGRRSLDATVKRLTPMLVDPNLAERVEAASKGDDGREVSMKGSAGDESMLAQVVGIIIGSPEYQRR